MHALASAQWRWASLPCSASPLRAVARMQPAALSGRGLPRWHRDEEPRPPGRGLRRLRFHPCITEDPLEEEVTTLPVLLPGNPIGRRPGAELESMGSHSWTQLGDEHTHTHILEQRLAPVSGLAEMV